MDCCDVIAGGNIGNVAGFPVESHPCPVTDSHLDVVSVVTGLWGQNQPCGGDIDSTDHAFVSRRGGHDQLDHPWRLLSGPFQFEPIARREVVYRPVFLVVAVSRDHHVHVVIQANVARDAGRHVPDPQPVAVVGDLLEHNHVGNGIAVARSRCRSAPGEEDQQQREKD